MIADLWYKNGVFYRLSVGTYMDANGDGIGDFKDLLRRLDYLQILVITTIWLMPFQPSLGKAVLVEGKKTAVSPDNFDGLSRLHFNENINRLLLCPSVLRQGILAMCEALHEALRDALKAIISEQIEANR
jgi:hypothetical protein